MKKKFFPPLPSMQLFCADATMFSKKKFIAHENKTENALKAALNHPQTFFSSTGPAAQTNPELIFHVINIREQASVL